LRLPPKKITYQDRIEMRPFSLVDSDLIYQAVKDSQSALKQFKAWAHFKKNRETALSIYSALSSKTSIGQEAHFCGFNKGTDDFLFCIGLFPDNRLNQHSMELGYWVSSKHSGEGFGTLSAQLTIYLAFFYYGADRLAIRSDPDNKGSLAIINKCGFNKEGVMRNSLAKPTREMLNDGYSTNRDSLYFSLISDDLKDLDWIDQITNEIEIIPII